MPTPRLTAAETEVFLPYMRDVTRCEQSLQELNLMWRIIEASAKMNCPQEARAILPTMAATRASFAQLEKELVTSLVHEKVQNTLTEIGTQAQYVIDIVVRNLYERTADVGFLATDRELCSFVAQLHDEHGRIHYRLREYRDKYTVYDEIILLDTEGHVLAQIDPTTPLEFSRDPLIQATLASDTYVETFRASDLRPGKERALIYSRRMHHPQTGAVVGVLCLCFHFEEEMASIFTSHREAAHRSNMLLLDAQERVIASADELWIPTGAKVPVNLDGAPRLMMYCGREYLVRTVRSDGYQGYPGPQGWMGQVMIPVDVAFKSSQVDLLGALDHRLTDGLLSHAQTFCPPLHDIMVAARHIQRIVWNGQVMTAGQQGEMLKLKTILDQISETGNRSNALFEQSIRDLYQTVLGSSLQDARFTAHLLVDLLDRNLYERSDDCRWWALSPELRQALTEGGHDAAQRIGAVLQYIHRLYTVYTRLVVYDRNGIIVSATGEAAESVVGQSIDPASLAKVLSLQSPQHYYASPFEVSPLYDDRPTYIYHAAIRHPVEESQIVGGIGIVFDSAPELQNMLLSGLGGRDKMAALFIDPAGRVLASTHPDHPVGSLLQVPDSLMALERGGSGSEITEHAGEYAIAAASVSCGYREFKTQDGYRDDVIAVVYHHFGQVRSEPTSWGQSRHAIDQTPGLTEGTEYATFFCQGSLMALPATHIQQAMSCSAMRPTSMGSRPGQIGLLGHQGERYVWVFDLGQLITGQRTRITANSQILLLEHEGHQLGLLVDELHAVAHFQPSDFMNSPMGEGASQGLITQLIKANKGQLLVQLVDSGRLTAWLLDGISPDSYVGLRQPALRQLA